MQDALRLDDGALMTPTALAMIQSLIPLELKAVEDALLAEVTALAGPRYARHDGYPAIVRWASNPAPCRSLIRKWPSRCRACATHARPS